MDSKQKLFENIFGSNKRSEEQILTSSEQLAAQSVYDIACSKIHECRRYPDGDPDDEPDEDPDDEPDEDPDDEPGDDNNDDDDSVTSFDKKIQAAMENFKKVVELFKLSSKAKKAFLENFPYWSSLRENNIRRLKEIAGEIQTDKFNSDIAKVVGGVVGVVGGVVVGLSLLTPLAAITLPLAISGGVASAVGGGVVVGTTGTEIVLLKNKLEEAKTLAKQEEENFAKMSQWFTHTQELKKALGYLIDCNLLNELSEDLQNFDNEAKYNLDTLKDGFKEVLTRCIGKMCKRSKIVELFGVVFAPVVMTFVLVVCLMRDNNRLVLDCILQVERFTLGILSALDIGVQAGRLTVGLAKSAAVAGRAVGIAVTTSVFVALGAAIDVVNVVLASIDIHKRPQPEHSKKIKDVANKLQEEFSFIKSVYNELKKWKSIDWEEVAEWKTFIIGHVPQNACQIDIKMAVKPHLSEEAWGCMKLHRQSIDGDNWIVKIPASHSQMLLRQSHLIIKRESCQVKQWTQWKTFIIHHVPSDAGQEDIRMAVRPYIFEEVWGSIKLQRLSTDGNNWIVKVPVRYSQNLVQQSYMIVKREKCLVTQ